MSLCAFLFLSVWVCVCMLVRVCICSDMPCMFVYDTLLEIIQQWQHLLSGSYNYCNFNDMYSTWFLKIKVRKWCALVTSCQIICSCKAWSFLDCCASLLATPLLAYSFLAEHPTFGVQLKPDWCLPELGNLVMKTIQGCWGLSKLFIWSIC